MEIEGLVHCFFEQSGAFKREFLCMGIPAEDYDTRTDFGETDHVIDLFGEIEAGYDGRPSVFDRIRAEDLIMAFFPCVYFCDAKTMMMKGTHECMRRRDLKGKMEMNIGQENMRHQYFLLLMKLVFIVADRGLRMIIENPWNTNGQSFLQNNFIKPSLIDKDRSLRGDFFVKPTAYWFIGCEPTRGWTLDVNRNKKNVEDCRGKNKKAGMCDEMRSAISGDYARNFINDFILGSLQSGFYKQLELFDLYGK